MDGTAEKEWLAAFEEFLNRSHLFQADQLAGAVDTAMSRLGVKPTIYLVDVEQQALRALPQPGRPLPPPQQVDTTIAGRAYRLGKMQPTRDRRGWWVPIVNGTERMGAVEFAVSGGIDPDDNVFAGHCATFAGLIGHLLTVTMPKGDYLYRVRRTQPMSAAAEILTHLLPPLTSSTERIALSAILEPCYDVGGDGFDYAVDDALARIYIFDAVGHGMPAAIASAVALAAIRATRRAGGGIYAQARAADKLLGEQFSDQTFVTAILAELDLDTGRMRYINAGHPPALVLRGGRVVRELGSGRRMPLGLDDAKADLGEEVLEPGDRLLLYSDGVIEARADSGEPFGVERLVDLAQRHTAELLPAPETLRRLAHAVGVHHGGPPADDATLVLADWSPEAARRTVP